MTESEKLFHNIIKKLPNGVEGILFGAKCIKSTNGKTAAFFWKNTMVFKLDEESQTKALKLKGAKIGHHLYAQEKPMNGWISIPQKQSDKWLEFSEKAINYVEILGI